jgi:hypothetical protein
MRSSAGLVTEEGKRRSRQNTGCSDADPIGSDRRLRLMKLIAKMPLVTTHNPFK